MALINSPDSRFMLADLTGEIQKLPNLYGYINSLNLFTANPTTQKSLVLDIVKTDISLIDSVETAGRSAESQRPEEVSQVALPFVAFKVVESMTPEELQGVRRTGTANELETDARVRAKKLAKIRTRFDITNEFLKMGALKGRVFDPQGQLRFDAFTAFGATKTTIKFGLADTSGVQFEAAIEQLHRHMEDNAQMGTIVDGQDIIILVNDVFFSKLITHPFLRDAYMAQQNPLSYQLITGSLRTGGTDGVQRSMNVFQYRGVKFVQYNGQFQDNRGVMHKLVGIEGKAATVGVGHAFPNVTMLPQNDLFQIAYAPVMKMGYTNTMGQPLYVFEYERPRDEGVDFEAHSIMMPYCTRPQLLVDITDEDRT
ncbi:major capsid protein [Pectobacterium phage Wc4-1]|uniref:Major capsid protein n=1 Tax=Pectobacterium phage Wc4 TaxID=2652428 RepID=A0A5P8D485_9CAUD|nr:major capsid protein [Pectobacterium phage Wc4]QFP94013.1 major capsid protein [Pectobacterium phage Wc4-1]